MFTTRNETGQYDFSIGDLTLDGSWHDIDFSSIVPPGVTAIALHVRSIASLPAAGTAFFLRTKTSLFEQSSCKVRPQVADLSFTMLFIQGVDASRILSYKSGVGHTFTTLYITVKGWFS